jgi:hypothetical protein
MRENQFCHQCGTRSERHVADLHLALEAADLNRAAERVSEIRAELAGQPAFPYTHRIKITLSDGSGPERDTREVLFFSWPGENEWWTQPLFAVRYGDGYVVHLRALRAAGDATGPVVDLPLEYGIRPYRDLAPRLLGWARTTYANWGKRGFEIDADPADADPNFWDRPSTNRNRLEALYARLFAAEQDYAELRDERAPLLQARGESLAARDYPLTARSTALDLAARDRYLRDELKRAQRAHGWPDIATPADLWEAAQRAGLVGAAEIRQAARLIGDNWNRGGD